MSEKRKPNKEIIDQVKEKLALKEISKKISKKKQKEIIEKAKANLHLDDPEKRPKLLATRIFQLNRNKKLQAINLMLPPGVRTFYVQRIDGHHIRFFVEMDEVMALIDEIEKQKKERLAKAEADKNKQPVIIQPKEQVAEEPKNK